MASPSYNLKNPAVKRIMQEIKEVQADTSGDFMAEALENDIFEWHFAIRGPADTEFEGGIYHGRILLPAEYPFKPPAFMMLTPSGRFETGVKICLSISAHHPEHWQPSWSVRTALTALVAFMPSPGAGALGSLDYTKEERRKLAAKAFREPPKFGSPERQRLIEEMHARMVAAVCEAAAAKPGTSAQPPASPAATEGPTTGEQAAAGTTTAAAVEEGTAATAAVLPPPAPPQEQQRQDAAGPGRDAPAAPSPLQQQQQQQGAHTPASTPTKQAPQEPQQQQQQQPAAAASPAAASAPQQQPPPANSAVQPAHAAGAAGPSPNVLRARGAAQQSTAPAPAAHVAGARLAPPLHAPAPPPPDTWFLTAVAVALGILIAAILLRKALVAAGLELPPLTGSTEHR